MLRKILLTLLIISTLLTFGVSPARAAKDYRAERFDVQFDLQPDGSALVTETVAFRFDGGPFTYAFRDIAATETDGVTFLSASMDGEQMPLGTRAGQVEVTGRDPLTVKWHFAPTSDTTHEFTVRYRVKGVVRKLDADMIRWRAIPQEHEYPIDRSSVTITHPASAKPIEPPTLDREFESSPLPNGYRLTTTNISADQDMILTARFAAGTAAATTPQWQIRQQQAEALGARTFPIGLLAAVATLVLGGFGIFTYARTHRREAIKSPLIPLTTLPAEIEPALAAKLIERSQGFMGTLFDLAERGVLEVHEDKGWWNSKKYTLELTNAAAPLSVHEQGLLSVVFKHGETTTDMAAIPSRLIGKHKVFDEPLERELIDRGWLDPDRKRQRTTLIALGFGLMLGGLGSLMLGAIGSGFAVASNDFQQAAPWAVIIGVSLSAFILSIPLMLYAVGFSPLTVDGEAEAARWKNFEKYLKQAHQDQATLSPDTFERYLAFAAAFGLGSEWAKHFQRTGGAPLPMWFHAMPGSDGDFGGIVAVMSASDSTGAGGDGGGASGGGSSGAG